MARVLTKEIQENKRKLEEDRRCLVCVDDPQVFPVERIVNVRFTTTVQNQFQAEYLIKFKGYSSKFDEWVAEDNVTPELKRAFKQEQSKKEIKRLQKKRSKRKQRKQLNRICKALKERNATIISQSELQPVASSSEESDGVTLVPTTSFKESCVEYKTQQHFSDKKNEESDGVQLESTKSSRESCVKYKALQILSDETYQEFDEITLVSSTTSSKKSCVENEAMQQLSDKMDVELNECVSVCNMWTDDLEPYLLGFDELLEPVLTYDHYELFPAPSKLNEEGTKGSELKAVTSSTDEMEDEFHFDSSTLNRVTEENLLGFDGLEPVFE